MFTEDEREELKSILADQFPDFYELAGGKNYRYHHLLRVHRYALKLMEHDELRGEEFDPEVVEAAALFHDVGRKEDIEDGYMDPFEGHDGHPERGAEKVGELLEEFLSDAQVEKVETVIRNHHSEPETAEGKLLQDADSLGIFGVMNIWRMVHYSADNERTLEEMFGYFWGSALEDYAGRLENLHFDVTRRTARKRLAKYQRLVSDMEQEHSGSDIV